ncbi:MAG: hypothetical protein ACLRWQ_03210 [Flavonifractor plautii]
MDDIWDETYPAPDTVHSVLAVEALPGQFDQRADSCAQCIQLQSGVDRPLIAYAKVYLLMGSQLSQEELEKIRKYLINPGGEPRGLPWTSLPPWSGSTPPPTAWLWWRASPPWTRRGWPIFCLSWAWRWIWMT